MNSDSTGARLTARVGLANLFDELGLHRRGSQAQCPSPHHDQSGRTPPVSLLEERGLWNCHGCGAGGTGVELLGLVRGLDVRAALDELDRRVGRVGGHHRGGADHRPSAQTVGPEPSRGLSDAQAAPILRRYVEGRGWRSEVVAAFDLTVVLDSWGRPRIRHPYRSGGDVKWWQDRAAHPDISPRWMCPRGMRRWPYALDLEAALDATSGDGDVVPGLVVVEGPGDVIAMWHAYGDRCRVIGLPGTAGSAEWAPMFAALDVVVALDADRSGDDASAVLVEAIGMAGGRACRVRPPDGADVCEWRQDLGDLSFREVFDEAARVAFAPISRTESR